MNIPFLTILAIALASGSAHAASTAETYMRNCAVCHLPGIAGAPKVGDTADWARRVRPGLRVYRNALEGLPNTAMMAKGGHTDLWTPDGVGLTGVGGGSAIKHLRGPNY